MKYLPLSLLITFLFPLAVWGEVKINEFSPDHTPQQVELINVSTQSADLSGWYIDDSGGTTYYEIPSGTTIYPQSCLVIEGDFNLNKSSADTVRLFTAAAPPPAVNAVLVDSYSYKLSPGTSNSFSRNPDAGSDWVTAPSSPGFFNQSNNSCLITPTPTLTSTPSPSPTVSPTITPIPIVPTATPLPDYGNIFINEVYPNPLPGDKEWIELYNDNNFEVNLTDWHIDDMENGGGTPKRFSINIASHGYAVVELSGSLFNNDGDSVRLLNPNKTQIDGFEYGKSQQGRSLGRISLAVEAVCLEEPSKNSANTPCIELSPTVQLAITSAPTASAWTPSSKPVFAENNVRTSFSNIDSLSQQSVLGETTSVSYNDKPDVNMHKSIRNFTSVSFSYSILTIVSLLIKIKNGLTA